KELVADKFAAICTLLNPIAESELGFQQEVNAAILDIQEGFFKCRIELHLIIGEKALQSIDCDRACLGAYDLALGTFRRHILEAKLLQSNKPHGVVIIGIG